MNLESEISGLQPLLREEIDRERERRLGELQGSLHELGNKELVLWEQSGEVVDELVAVWNSYRELLEQRSAIYQQAIHSGTLTMDDGDAYQEIQTLTKGPTSPACGTIITFHRKDSRCDIGPQMVWATGIRVAALLTKTGSYRAARRQA